MPETLNWLAYVQQATHTARGWIEQGCPPGGRWHVLAALAQTEEDATRAYASRAASDDVGLDREETT